MSEPYQKDGKWFRQVRVDSFNLIEQPCDAPAAEAKPDPDKKTEPAKPGKKGK